MSPSAAARLLPATLLVLAVAPSSARAQCFASTGEELWPNREVVYEVDRTALTAASMTTCLDPELVASYQQYSVDHGVHSIEDWFLMALEDWINGDPDIEQPLTYRARVGDEEPYILLTSYCVLWGGELGNRVSTSSQIPGRTGQSVRYINLRPTDHTIERFEETVRHEVGHVLGLQHAQERPDRDDHLVVHPEVQDDNGYVEQSLGFCDDTMYGLPFDFASIMLYPPRPREPDLTCTFDDQADCALAPAYDDDLGTNFEAMQHRTITTADRWAVRLHYSWTAPEQVGLYNPRTSLYAMARIADDAAAGNAYAYDDVAHERGISLTDFNGVFDRDLSLSPAYVLVGDWTDPAEGGAEHLAVAWKARDGRAWDLPIQRDLDEDMDGEDELPVHLAVSSEAIPFVGDFDGDPATAPSLALYDPLTDSYAYDADADGTLETEVWGFLTTDGAPWPVAADVLDNGYDSVCVLYRDWGYYACDLDGDDVPDAATAFTTRTGQVYPLVGDWNGDGVDDLGVYDAAQRVFELDRDDDYTIAQPDAFGLGMDLVFSPDSNQTPQADDIDLVPFSGRFDADALEREVYTLPWADAWCEMLEGEVICDDPWVVCHSLSEASGGEHSGVVCVDYLEDTWDELPEDCVWDFSQLACW